MSLNIEVLEQSFSRVKPHASEFAAKFYQNLFTDYPQVRSLFANTDMQTQENKLMQSLLLVLLNLRYPDAWTGVLKDLGERHVRYDTMQEHYPIVGATLLKTLEFYLGTSWTPEVKQAWSDAYQEIVNIMLQGAAGAEKIRQEAQQLSALSADKQATKSVPTIRLRPNLKLFLFVLLAAGVLGFAFLHYNRIPNQENNDRGQGAASWQ